MKNIDNKLNYPKISKMESMIEYEKNISSVNQNPIPQTSEGSTLYVGNLDKTINKDALTAHFSKFGQIGSVTIPLRKPGNQPRGYAFVKFLKKEDAEKALKDLQYTTIGNKQIKIMF